jgi:hypothetical protein
MDYKIMYDSLLDSEKLKYNLQYISIFVALYENMTTTAVENVKSFYHEGFSVLNCDTHKAVEEVCNNMRKDCFHEDLDGYRQYYSPKYKTNILERKHNGKKNVLLSSMLWFVEFDAITQDEYITFLRVRDIRNKYVHEMIQFLYGGLPGTADIELKELMLLHRKLDQWWINQVEIPTSPDDIPNDYDAEGVMSFDSAILDVVIDVLQLSNDAKCEDYFG